MINWFNQLDTGRRLFVLAVLGFYVLFFYFNLGHMLHFLKLYFFNREAFDLQMELTDFADDASALGVSFGSPLADSISAFKWLGISALVTALISYAVFRKKEV